MKNGHCYHCSQFLVSIKILLVIFVINQCEVHNT
eukprot:XP_001704504.1 Hypothetical protein GL50803_1726 [Giardia lamblia ATCC 50803]